MSPIYTGDKFGFGASTSAGGGGGAHVYNNAGMVFTTAGAYGSAGPSIGNLENEYKDQKFWTGNHYFNYWGGSYEGFIFVRAPQTGTYTFDMRGAFGGPSNPFDEGTNKGGSPWYLKGEVDLVGGRWIGVVVGQRGGEAGESYNSSTGGGGGGGTFLFELDGSESETALTKSYVESASVTCLLVAAGGNGANWNSWQSQDTPARGETGTGATDWILGAINAGNNYGHSIFGRGAFGGSFNYTPYSTVDSHNNPGPQNPWFNNYPSGKPWMSGSPLLDVNGKIHEGSLWGGTHYQGNENRYRDKNYDPNHVNTEGAFGGFGGGGGTIYEGGGGGGYWGGAAWQENQYNTTYNYGAQSYAHPTRATVTVSSIYGDGTSGYGNELSGLDRFDRSRRFLNNGNPHPEMHGKLYLCPKAPKATAIGEAVFHADGHNIGEDKPGVGKVTKYDWYVPEGVTSISVITVGGGGSGMARHDGASGGGGSLAYKNNIAVTPGQRIGVQVGCGGFMRSQDVSMRSPKGTDSKITVYPFSSGGAGPSTGSVYLDGSSVVKANISGSQFAIPGGSSFGIEAWVNYPSISGYQNVFSTWDSNGSYQNTMLHVDTNGNLFFAGYGGSTYTSNGTKQVTAGNWHHVYVGSNGSSGEFYIDGTMCGGWSNSGAMDSGRPLYIGANMDGSGGSGGGNYRPTGYISNLRWVTGHKTYDANFTPPTAPVTATSQGVPASACKLVAFNDDSDYQTTYQTSASFSMTSQYGSPTASSESPFSAGGTATVYAIAGGGYGAYQSGQSCGPSHSTDEDKALGGTFSNADGGGNGGNGMVYTGCRQGGGGAGGYNGYGKNLSGFPSNHNYSGCSGDNGSDGGGGGGAGANGSSSYYSGGGGGVGIYGQGANGAKGDTNQNGSPDGNDSVTDFAGKGGSPAHGTGLDGYTNRNPSYYNLDGARGGMTGYNKWRNNYWNVTGATNYRGPDGGFPGGGAGGGHGSDIWGMGGHGVVRIIWGAGREFPSTNVDISTTYDSDADIFRIGTQPQY